MKVLFIAWQDPISRYWFPIGRLTVENKTYCYQYIKGVFEAKEKGGFEPLGAFPDLYEIYESDELFPLFAKRVLSPSRPEYPDFVSWLGLTGTEIDPLELLSRSGGQTVTDRFEVFPLPEKTRDNKYHSHFFAHGLRHFPGQAIERVDRLKAKERLYLANEFQNPFDSKAMLLCTEDHFAVGYCPKYLLHDAENLWDEPDRVIIEVEQDVSPKTPLQFRLLCGMTASWKKSESPFNKERYRAITDATSTPYDTNADLSKEAGVCRDSDS